MPALTAAFSANDFSMVEHHGPTASQSNLDA
jgi:hypothetical protein